jgi:hypothetical protein
MRAWLRGTALGKVTVLQNDTMFETTTTILRTSPDFTNFESRSRMGTKPCAKLRFAKAYTNNTSPEPN